MNSISSLQTYTSNNCFYQSLLCLKHQKQGLMCSMYMPGGSAHRHDELCRQHTLGSLGSPVLPPLFLCPSLPAIEIRMPKPKTSAEQSVAAPAIKVKFYSRCKILGKVAESFSKAIFTHLVLFKIPTFFGVFLASYHCIRLLSDISCFSGPSFGRLFKRFPDTWILLCQDLKKSCEFSFQVQGVRATF